MIQTRQPESDGAACALIEKRPYLERASCGIPGGGLREQSQKWFLATWRTKVLMRTLTQLVSARLMVASRIEISNPKPVYKSTFHHTAGARPEDEAPFRALKHDISDR
ncbi:hypothetical protein KIN20_007135 [Parelaphostrongylus tenuis]|uniref:Uncharacterized protein n=1 Tax=Parelaphostrongylus tenuis TaxID=148309 RepID=A0AAD5M4Z5_PARTN|nr:hypothetical protein KIN20_007135 [Parelaphostrongylus tenuis]